MDCQRRVPRDGNRPSWLLDMLLPEFACGLASWVAPHCQISRSFRFPPDPLPRRCQYRQPHPSSLHPSPIQDRLFSVFRFCGRRSFPANVGASPSFLVASRLNTAGFATVRRSARPLALQAYFVLLARSGFLLRLDRSWESSLLRPCSLTITLSGTVKAMPIVYHI